MEGGGVALLAFYNALYRSATLCQDLFSETSRKGRFLGEHYICLMRSDLTGVCGGTWGGGSLSLMSTLNTLSTY